METKIQIRVKVIKLKDVKKKKYKEREPTIRGPSEKTILRMLGYDTRGL